MCVAELYSFLSFYHTILMLSPCLNLVEFNFFYVLWLSIVLQHASIFSIAFVIYQYTVFNNSECEICHLSNHYSLYNQALLTCELLGPMQCHFKWKRHRLTLPYPYDIKSLKRSSNYVQSHIDFKQGYIKNMSSMRQTINIRLIMLN